MASPSPLVPASASSAGCSTTVWNQIESMITETLVAIALEQLGMNAAEDTTQHCNRRVECAATLRGNGRITQNDFRAERN